MYATPQRRNLTIFFFNHHYCQGFEHSWTIQEGSRIKKSDLQKEQIIAN